MENKDQVFNLDMFVLNLSVLFLLMIKNASEIKFPSNSLFISPISKKKKKKKDPSSESLLYFDVYTQIFTSYR